MKVNANKQVNSKQLKPRKDKLKIGLCQKLSWQSFYT